ncbi:phosphotransferase family protein [Hwanghaeella grinnelliae]|uniref:Phosphotransferase family protein n=1 Tax=Hwanghaeella grinnelliae TaxID=2500179 RepID=A0A437QN09_9PROT|nr:phosphotransferase family protein [Hwanghaeella grinnelliae]RVU35923.1 phosphotransferase family protein [Hwanghaeella grinnelliae]
METGPSLKSASEQQDQDWARLADYLSGQGMVLDLKDHPPRQFAAGFGNLNFLIHVDGKAMVLRRPPLGPIPPGANDMGRESGILSNLWKEFPLAPRCRHACSDPEVIGAPFFIMDYREGRVIGGDVPEDIAEPDRRRIGLRLMDVLADLHGVDPAAVGLDGLGKPEGFLGRTIEGWSKRAHLAWGEDAPGLVDEVCGWLRDRVPPDHAVSLIHNDFKLDNVILDRDGLDPVAVLDWDMGTRGDPLFDLAVTLAYWTEPNDPQVMHKLNQMPTAAPGFPTRAEAMEAYAEASGRDLSDFIFQRVLGQFRLAVVFAQLHRRWREGGTMDPKFAEFGSLAEDLLTFTHDIAQGRVD